ncbi:MAG: hypothetical protein ACQETP_09475, partial [Bacteroidota bacterium]
MDTAETDLLIAVPLCIQQTTAKNITQRCKLSASGLSPRGRDAILDYGLWIVEAFYGAGGCALVSRGWTNGGVEGWTGASLLCYNATGTSIRHRGLCTSNCRHSIEHVGEAAVSVQSSILYAPSTIFITNREQIPSSWAHPIANLKSQILNAKGLSPRGRDAILDYGLWIVEAFYGAGGCALVSRG